MPIELEEKEKRKWNLYHTKKDLWKLKGREKKLGEPQNKEHEKIKNLTMKGQKIVEILEIERKRVETEKKVEEETRKD